MHATTGVLVRLAGLQTERYAASTLVPTFSTQRSAPLNRLTDVLLDHRDNGLAQCSVSSGKLAAHLAGGDRTPKVSDRGELSTNTFHFPFLQNVCMMHIYNVRARDILYLPHIAVDSSSGKQSRGGRRYLQACHRSETQARHSQAGKYDCKLTFGK